MSHTSDRIETDIRGTIVLQPELSKNSSGITERDSKELYTDGEGRTKLRRNSNLFELDNLALYAEHINKINGHTVCICDTDMILVDYSDVKAYLGKHITKKFYDVICENASLTIPNKERFSIIPITNDDNLTEVIEQFICPIDVDATVVGAIIVITKRNEYYDRKRIGDSEIKLTETIAKDIAEKVELVK